MPRVSNHEATADDTAGTARHHDSQVDWPYNPPLNLP